MAGTCEADVPLSKSAQSNEYCHLNHTSHYLRDSLLLQKAYETVLLGIVAAGVFDYGAYASVG